MLSHQEESPPTEQRGNNNDVVVLAALWPILLNTSSAVRELNPILLDTARSLRLSRTRTVFGVLLPSVMPAVIVGIRVATPVALVITLLVEYLTAVNGVGALVGDAQRTFQPRGCTR